VERFVLVPTPPFRLDLTAWALRRRASNEIDRWDGEAYRRTLVSGGAPLEIEVRQEGDAAAPRLEVRVSGEARAAGAGRAAVIAALERLLGLRADLGAFYRVAARDRRLDALALRFRGVGRWSAEYALLRGLGRLHVFPGDDVGARNHLQRWLDLGKPLDYAGVERALGRWRRYQGLLYFHLLLMRLADEGTLAA
jgi:3-methyladenine DNA glycosylase/8-oxoguanine DNA glycosylase